MGFLKKYFISIIETNSVLFFFLKKSQETWEQDVATLCSKMALQYYKKELDVEFTTLVKKLGTIANADDPFQLWTTSLMQLITTCLDEISIKEIYAYKAIQENQNNKLNNKLNKLNRNNLKKTLSDVFDDSSFMSNDSDIDALTMPKHIIYKFNEYASKNFISRRDMRMSYNVFKTIKKRCDTTRIQSITEKVLDDKKNKDNKYKYTYWGYNFKYIHWLRSSMFMSYEVNIFAIFVFCVSLIYLFYHLIKVESKSSARSSKLYSKREKKALRKEKNLR